MLGGAVWLSASTTTHEKAEGSGSHSIKNAIKVPLHSYDGFSQKYTSISFFLCTLPLTSHFPTTLLHCSETSQTLMKRLRVQQAGVRLIYRERQEWTAGFLSQPL